MNETQKTQATLSLAILERRIIVFMYDRHFRKAIPATLGVSNNEYVMLSAYQIGGVHSNGSRREDWVFCNIMDISSLEITDCAFDKDPPNFKKNNTRLHKIIAEL